MVFILPENALSNQLDIVIIGGGGGGGGLEGIEKIVYAVSQYLYVKLNTTLFFFFNKRAHIPYTILYKKTKKGWNLRKLRNLII